MQTPEASAPGLYTRWGTGVRREEQHHRLAQLGGPMVSTEPILELNGGGGVDQIGLVDVGSTVVQLETPSRLPGLLRARWWQLAAKRGVDIAGSLAALLVLMP